MNELVLKDTKFNDIITKAGDINSLTFHTIDEKSLTEINSWMPEVNRAVSCFNKQNSQTTSSLMQLTMLESGPYRILRQILAQAEKKRMALKEVVYKLELKKIKYKKLSRDQVETTDNLEAETIEIKKNKIGCDIIDSQGHIEGALKELGGLKRRYEEICKNNDIPENWDEQDFENAEVEHHIKSMFRNAIRDKMQGHCNMGTMEYMEQFGINPITAYALVDNYINTVKQLIEKEGIGPDINAHYSFLDSMYNTFKEAYKKALKRIGLDSILAADFLMKENK